MVNIVCLVLMVIGVLFFALGTLGLWRFPDVFSRVHSTTKCDTLGCGLILLALGIKTGFSSATFKLVMILAFIWLTNATAAHVIAKAAFNGNYPMVKGTARWNYLGKGE